MLRKACQRALTIAPPTWRSASECVRARRYIARTESSTILTPRVSGLLVDRPSFKPSRGVEAAELLSGEAPHTAGTSNPTRCIRGLTCQTALGHTNPRARSFERGTAQSRWLLGLRTMNADSFQTATNGTTCGQARQRLAAASHSSLHYRCSAVSLQARWQPTFLHESAVAAENGLTGRVKQWVSRDVLQGAFS
eukprot:scaffold124160_cov30-Tisochrysis_lutea.AAC.2